MDTILIAGVESIIGTNLAATLSDRYNVIGLTNRDSFSIVDCETICCSLDKPEVIHEQVAKAGPDQIVFCGSAAHSTWQNPLLQISRAEAEATARSWADAAREADSKLTIISADGVFTGPWMFHREESTSLCDSSQARAARALEGITQQACPGTLVVRTNVYGWAAEAAAGGWIEQTLSELEFGSAGPFNYLRHATPILATDLIEILEQAWQENLEGVYHIAGSERVNPNQFVERMAAEFGIPGPNPVEGNCLVERPKGFGQGESSLHTGKLRKVLDVAMPTVTAGLQRLREQKHSGYCERLQSGVAAYEERVA